MVSIGLSAARRPIAKQREALVWAYRVWLTAVADRVADR